MAISKDLADRISYYLKKVCEKNSVHPSKLQPRSYTYRNERLRLYKKMMHEEIKAAGYIHN